MVRCLCLLIVSVYACENDLITSPLTISKETDGHAYRLELMADPPPRLGLNMFSLTVNTLNGKAVSSAEISVEPWMPLHGHGSDRPSLITETGDGLYHLTEVSFTMPGQWELRTQLTVDGLTEYAVFTVDVQ